MDTVAHYSANSNCLAELITQGTLHQAIGDGTRDAIKETADGTRTTTTAAYNAGLAAVEAANRNGIAAIKETSDSSRDNLRETARVGSDLASAISDARSATERTSLESRLAFQIALGLTNERVSDTSRDNLIAIKDNGFAIRDEGCKTREKLCEVEHNLEKSIFNVEKELLKGFHQTQLEALKNKCDLEAKIAECCCENKALVIGESNATRALILSENNRKTEAENIELRTRLMVLSGGILAKQS